MKTKKPMIAFLTVIIMSVSVKMAEAGIILPRGQNLLSNFIKVRVHDNAFSDIEGHWAEEHVANAYGYGIISGIGNGLYDPDGPLTLAQAITIGAMMHVTYKYPDTGDSVLEGHTTATASGHWADPFVNYAISEGLIADEWGDTLEKPVTRAETIGIWSRILRSKDMTSINSVNSLPDIDLSTPYFAEITLFYEAGIVRGSTINGIENCFNPDGTLSRAEAATIFMMIVEADKRMSGRTYGEKIVSIFAGTGTSGFSGGTARNASFTLPHGLTVDNNGRVVVFDTYNNALRLVNNGQVETIAGEMIGDDENRFSRGFYRDGLLSEALFNRPSDGVYNADGELFVCDSENNVIRLIRGGSVYTLAGTEKGHTDGVGSDAKFNTPMAIAIDKNGNLYIADTMNNSVRRIDVKGNVTTVAGIPGESGYADGNADASLFRNPWGIAVNGDGSVIYVADTGNHRIRKIEDGKVTTLSGVTTETDADGDPLGGYRDGKAEEALFNLPKGITLAGDILFVADSGNNAVRAVDMRGKVFTVAGTGEPGDCEGGILTAEFNQPTGILWHEGVLYVADTTNNMIKMLNVEITTFKEAE